MVTVKSLRIAGVPLAVIETSDPQQTISSVVKELNGKANYPLMRWDICRALVGLNEQATSWINAVTDGNAQIATTNPTECLGLLAKAPERSLTFFMSSHRFWDNETVSQGIWNLRDRYKTIGATLIMLCPLGSKLPVDLQSDVVALTDTLPNAQEVRGVVEGVLKAGGVEASEEQVQKYADTVTGLSAFTAEQVLAMSIRAGTNNEARTVDADAAWETKRKMIENTQGLSVWRGGETFSDVGGYETVKRFIGRIFAGKGVPKGVLFIDEIEKAMAGTSGDTSGTSQDQLKTLLTWMQDSPNVTGMMFIGPPGSGKSAVAKAAGNEAGVPTIEFDLGAMKGSLVGQSEQRIRAALDVVDAVTEGSVLVIATCNSIGAMPPELRRRFQLGTFYFPLPSKKARTEIWRIWVNKLGIKPQFTFNDDLWTGAEIRTCCQVAWRTGMTLTEASAFVVPVAVSARDQLNKLSREADRRYINAETGGLYLHAGVTEEQVSASVRRIEA